VWTGEIALSCERPDDRCADFGANYRGGCGASHRRRPDRNDAIKIIFQQEDDQVKIKTALAVIALTLTPSFALAMVCSETKATITASTCADGLVLDAEKGICTAPVTG